MKKLFIILLIALCNNCSLENPDCRIKNDVKICVKQNKYMQYFMKVKDKNGLSKIVEKSILGDTVTIYEFYNEEIIKSIQTHINGLVSGVEYRYNLGGEIDYMIKVVDKDLAYCFKENYGRTIVEELVWVDSLNEFYKSAQIEFNNIDDSIKGNSIYYSRNKNQFDLHIGDVYFQEHFESNYGFIFEGNINQHPLIADVSPYLYLSKGYDESFKFKNKKRFDSIPNECVIMYYESFQSEKPNYHLFTVFGINSSEERLKQNYLWYKNRDKKSGMIETRSDIKRLLEKAGYYNVVER